MKTMDVIYFDTHEAIRYC